VLAAPEAESSQAVAAITDAILATRAEGVAGMTKRLPLVSR
jgi:hypothetical protein